jgi:hypothetical protein
MKLKTRTVEIAGISRQPDANWMTQVIRNLTDAEDGFLRGVHYLLLDRDPLYTVAFRNQLGESGVTPLLLPARSPSLNAFAERFVGSVRSEFLARMVPLGEKRLRAAVRAFVDHYHEERPHQGLAMNASRPRPPWTLELVAGRKVKFEGVEGNTRRRGSAPRSVGARRSIGNKHRQRMDRRRRARAGRRVRPCARALERSNTTSACLGADALVPPAVFPHRQIREGTLLDWRAEAPEHLPAWRRREPDVPSLGCLRGGQRRHLPGNQSLG